jgi:hypothetical protein
MNSFTANDVKVGEVFEIEDDPTKMPVTVVVVKVVWRPTEPGEQPMDAPYEPQKDALLKKLNEIEG